MDRTTAQTWVDRFFDAWRTMSASGAAELFTAEAVYWNHPFEEPRLGTKGITAYWQGGVDQQQDIDIRVGTPLVDGNRVAVEWWVSLTQSGTESTSSGVLILTFDGDLCSELREVWIEQPGRVEPPQGWGA